MLNPFKRRRAQKNKERRPTNWSRLLRYTPRLESLESRLAPATLVNPTTLTYQDVDGDNVTVRFSKPVLSNVNADNVFFFDTGSVNGDNSTPQQLQEIGLFNLTPGGPDPAGVGI